MWKMSIAIDTGDIPQNLVVKFCRFTETFIMQDIGEETRVHLSIK